MKLVCGCEYDGPVQTLSCPEHNAAAKNLNRAQAMILDMEHKLSLWREVFLEARQRVAGLNSPRSQAELTDWMDTVLASEKLK